MRRASVLLVAALLVLAPLAPSRAAAPPREAERWALVVGIDRFQGRTRPNVGAVGDAHDFRDALLANGFAGERIRMLTDGAATAAAIREGLRWLRSKATPRSFVVFHYSGHTKQLKGDRDRDGEALDEYLWPHDNVFISDREVADLLRPVPGFLWADFSGCEGAGFDDALAGPNRLVTAASAEHEKGYEHPQWRNSVFTGLLVDQGMNQRQADANGDGRVSIHEGFRFASTRAPQITAEQRYGPQHPYLAGGDGNEWFLQAPPPAPPTRAPRGDGDRERSCAFLLFCS